MKTVSVRLIVALVLFFAAGARAEMTNGLPDAEIQGRQLARQLCEARPTENFTNKGVLKIRNANGTPTNFPIKFEIIVSTTNWQNIYTVSFVDYDNGHTFGWKGEIVTVNHSEHETNQYKKTFAFTYGSKWKDGSISDVGPNSAYTETLSGDKIAIPFGNSDFWICDLGLEFLHWPAQKVLPKTTTLKRSREYTLLESTNPSPSTNGYSRVLSWIDKETGGILAAEAYDAQGKLLKVFEPKSFKKVNGQWELQEMEIRNVQTGSRTRLEFDLKK